ncbi:MAG: hypothetical protein D3908_12545, partial [Candidatus Electrothrix sp. AUS4]|nr:hypothetical protein [Candidatus Electrothrix sp. AUS4]
DEGMAALESDRQPWDPALLPDHCGLGSSDPVIFSLVAVFGSTDHIATGPYSEKASIVRQPVECSPCMKTHCPKGHFQCMEGITVEEVEQAALRWLENKE